MNRNNRNLIISIAIAVVIIGGFIGVVTMKQPNDSGMTMASGRSSSRDNAVMATAVTIQGYMFEPGSIKVKVGDTVTWTNQDSVDHSIIADNPSSDAPNGQLFGKGETYKFKFMKPGTYQYHCGPHPSMVGTVEVTK